MTQKLRGFVGQGMTGARKALDPLSYVYSAGSYTFTPTKSGWYRFVLWGPGGPTSGAGQISSGGALVIAERPLSAGQPVAIVVGGGNDTTATNSTITLPTGEVLTAGAGAEGSAIAGGTASGNAQLGDILVNGGASDGAGTPGFGGSSGNYRGGVSTSSVTNSPGGGGKANENPGSGLCVIHQTRMRL